MDVRLTILLLLSGLLHAQNHANYRVQTLAGSSFAGDGGSALQALLRQAEGVTAGADGTLYIADAADHRVRAVSPEGIIRTVAGTGSPGFSGDEGPGDKARLNGPYGLSVDRKGNLYIADLGNARIRLLTTDGIIHTVAGGGDIPAGETAEGSAATMLKFKTPRNVLADNNGGFSFSDFDGHRIYFVDFQGILTILAGTGSPGYGADNIAAHRSALRNPAGLAFEPQGGIVVAESGAQRLRRIARGMIGPYLPDFVRLNPLFSPTGIAFDSTGALYIADARNTGALKRSAQGETTALSTGGPAVAAAPNGGAYYASGQAVTRVDTANKVSLFAGGAMAGALQLENGSALEARLQSPAAVAVDKDGSVYFSDEGSHRVRKISPGGVISTIAGTGRAAFSGDGGPASKASLNAPRGIAFDRYGNLLIADSGNHALRMIAVNGVITTLAGNGFKGTRGDGGPAIAAQFDSPSAVAVDPFGSIFIADSGNHRVRRIGTSGLIGTYAGTGVAGTGIEGSAAAITPLNDPRGLAFDAAGNLFIADTGNNRIRRVDVTGLFSSSGDTSLRAPRGIAVAANGTLYAADTGRHRIVAIDGLETRVVAGRGTPGLSGDGASAADAEFQYPAGLGFDAAGNLLVADTGNGRIRRLLPVKPAAIEQVGLVRSFHAATGLESPIAPRMLVTLRGENLGPAQGVESKDLPRSLAGVEVRIGGQPVGLLYVSANQINVLAPPAFDTRGPVTIEVLVNGTLTASSEAAIAESSPGLFAMAVHEDGSLNAQTNPASRGSIVTLFATGEGLAPLESANVTIGANRAAIESIRPVPDTPGLLAISVRLPTGFYAAGAYKVALRFGSAAAPETLSIFIQ